MWKTGALLAASLATGLVLVEVLLRGFVPPHVAAQASARFELDPDLIYRLRPHNVVTWQAAEFTETSRTNALGMRGPEVGAKRPDEHRVLALGDSFTYGHGVQDDEAYPAVLEALLRAAGHDATVLNAGVPGYSSDQSYARFVRDGLAVRPDLLLVGIHCSDVSDNFERPLYDVVAGRLVPLEARHTWMYRLGSVVGSVPALVQESRLFDLLLTAVDWQEPERRQPAVPDLEAWSREKIRLQVRDMRARGAPAGMAVAVVIMPCKKVLLAGEADPYGPLGRDLAALDVPILDAGDALGLAHPDLAALFFRDDPHLNPRGARALAETVAAFLAAEGLPG